MKQENAGPVHTHNYLTIQQLEYFQEWLLHLKREFEEKLKKHSFHIHDKFLNEPDFIDRASLETSHSLEIEAQSRERGQIFEINQALKRIHNGTYGYCEETSEPIDLARLEAYPMETLCLEAQERSEQFKKKRYS